MKQIISVIYQYSSHPLSPNQENERIFGNCGNWKNGLGKVEHILVSSHYPIVLPFSESTMLQLCDKQLLNNPNFPYLSSSSSFSQEEIEKESSYKSILFFLMKWKYSKPQFNHFSLISCSFFDVPCSPCLKTKIYDIENENQFGFSLSTSSKNLSHVFQWIIGDGIMICEKNSNKENDENDETTTTTNIKEESKNNNQQNHHHKYFISINNNEEEEKKNEENQNHNRFQITSNYQKYYSSSSTTNQQSEDDQHQFFSSSQQQQSKSMLFHLSISQNMSNHILSIKVWF